MQIFQTVTSQKHILGLKFLLWRDFYSTIKEIDSPYLIIHVTAREERTPGVGELCEDTACAPHVDAGGVELGPEEDVRRAIPEGDHLGTVTTHWDAEGPS